MASRLQFALCSSSSWFLPLTSDIRTWRAEKSFLGNQRWKPSASVDNVLEEADLLHNSYDATACHLYTVLHQHTACRFEFLINQHVKLGPRGTRTKREVAAAKETLEEELCQHIVRSCRL